MSGSISRLVVVALLVTGCSGVDTLDLGDGRGVGFRGGPDRVGTVDGTVGADPVEVWSIDTGDYVISSPVPFEDGVLVIGHDGVLRALDADGEGRWQSEVGEIESTPVVVGNVVIAATSAGLAAFGAGDGSLIWEIDLEGAIRSSPLVSDGIVVVGAGEDLVAVEAADGSVRWRSPLPGDTGASPATDGDTVMIGDSTNVVTGFDLDDGSELWAHDFGPTSDDLFVVAGGLVSAPAIEGGMAYLGSTNGRVAALAVSSGEPAWETDLGTPVYASVAIAELLYLTTASGQAVALDPASGEEVWRVDLGRPSYASPTLTDDLLLVTTEEGIVVGLDPTDGAERWRVTIGRDGDFMASTPTLIEGLVVVGSNDGRIVALGGA